MRGRILRRIDMKRQTWIIVAVVAVAVVLCLCLCAAVAAGYALFAGSGSRVSDAVSTQIDVGAGAPLRVVNPVGDVTVETGTEGLITVQARREVGGFLNLGTRDQLDNIQVQAATRGGRAVVEVVIPQPLRQRSAKVDLTLTVPPGTDLDIDSPVGQVRILGTRGNVRVRGDVGDVMLQDVTVPKSCDVQNNVGAIRFQGRLPQGEGEVLLCTDVGEVEVAVPEGSAFALDAETSVGDVSSGFELAGRQAGQGDGVTGQWLRGYANGQGNGVRLVLRTGTGNIDIKLTP
jgi:hypothetical protein